jgi:hypothetical protein
MAPLKPKFSSPSLAMKSGALGAFASLEADQRTEEQFTAEVNRYVQEAPRRFEALLTLKLFDSGSARLSVAIANGTARNFEQVQVELTFPTGVDPYLTTRELSSVLTVSDPPKAWGKDTIGRSITAMPIVPSIPAAKLNLGPEITRGEATLIRFAPCHVRPGDSGVPLPDVHLVIARQLAGSTIKVRWRITSTSADGWTEGDLLIGVDEEVKVFDTRAA